MRIQLIPSWSWVRRQGTACSSCPIAKSLLEPVSNIKADCWQKNVFLFPKKHFYVVRLALEPAGMLGACQLYRLTTMNFATETVWPALWTHLTYCAIYRHNAMVGISVEPLTVIEGLTPAAQVGVRDCTLNWWSQAWSQCSKVWWLFILMIC